MASNEIVLANSVIAAAQAEGKEPDHKLNVASLLEGREILKLDASVVLKPEGAFR